MNELHCVNTKYTVAHIHGSVLVIKRIIKQMLVIVFIKYLVAVADNHEIKSKLKSI